MFRKSDELIQAAQQALVRGDADQAFEALRVARILTPLREDIRILAGEAASLRASHQAARPSKVNAPSQFASVQSAPQPRLDASQVAASKPAASKLAPSGSVIHSTQSVDLSSSQPPSPLSPPSPPSPFSPSFPLSPSSLSSSPSPLFPPSPSSPTSLDSLPSLSSLASLPSIASPSTQTSPVSVPPSSFSNTLRTSSISRFNPLAWAGIVGLLGIVVISVVTVLQNHPEQSAAGTTPTSEPSVKDDDDPILKDQLSEARRELAAGSPFKAAARLQALLEKKPKAIDQITPILVQAHIQRGQQLSKDDSYKQALESYVKAAGLSPANSEALAGQGWCFYILGRQALERKKTQTAQEYFTKSLAAYENALKVDPQLAKAHLGKARVYAAQSRRGQAAASYETVISNHPDTPEAKEAKRMLTMLTGKKS